MTQLQREIKYISKNLLKTILQVQEEKNYSYHKYYSFHINSLLESQDITTKHIYYSSVLFSLKGYVMARLFEKKTRLSYS